MTPSWALNFGGPSIYLYLKQVCHVPEGTVHWLITGGAGKNFAARLNPHEPTRNLAVEMLNVVQIYS